MHRPGMTRPSGTIMVLDCGKLIGSGPPLELLADPLSCVTALSSDARLEIIYRQQLHAVS